MEKKVLTVIFPGFEEIEFVAPVDIMRRANIKVVISSLNNEKLVTGRSDLTIQAEVGIDEIDPNEFDLFFLPGGPGVRNIRKNSKLTNLIKKFFDSGKYVAAICAAPLVFHDAGILNNVQHTAHFSTYNELTNAIKDKKVVEDKKIITSQGAGTAIDLGLHIVKVLCGEEKSHEIAKAIMF